MPDDESTDKHAKQRQNYQRLFCAEGLLLLTSCLSLGHGGKVGLILWTSLAVWHAVAIPICVLYLLGMPVVMTLVPLVDSAETREFRRELRERDELDDEVFFRQFYAESDLTSEVIAGVRRALVNVDPLLLRAVPSDKLFLIYDELDFTDVLDLVEEQLGVNFLKSDHTQIDGTLDNLLRISHAKTIQRMGSFQ